MRLDLKQNITKEPGILLGLCDNPINVLGYINAKVKVGNVQLLCEVLDSNNPTFMGRFREVSFDFEGGRVKLGDIWEPVHATVSG